MVKKTTILGFIIILSLTTGCSSLTPTKEVSCGWDWRVKTDPYYSYEECLKDKEKKL